MNSSAQPQSSRENVIPIDSAGMEIVLDTCGTGGDIRHTFNISTAAALIAAGAGVKVVKHGNRSASGHCRRRRRPGKTRLEARNLARRLSADASIAPTSALPSPVPIIPR